VRTGGPSIALTADAKSLIQVPLRDVDGIARHDDLIGYDRHLLSRKFLRTPTLNYFLS